MTTLQPQRNKRKYIDEGTLPTIPEKRYFTIGEASYLCGVKPHVLRYWEQEFPRLRPSKRRGNRRYYQHKDVVTARLIRKLLYEEGFTIEGARTRLLGEVTEVNKSTQMDTQKIITDLQMILQALKMET